MSNGGEEDQFHEGNTRTFSSEATGGLEQPVDEGCYAQSMEQGVLSTRTFVLVGLLPTEYPAFAGHTNMSVYPARSAVCHLGAEWIPVMTQCRGRVTSYAVRMA
jgi:hypothetical protein